MNYRIIICSLLVSLLLSGCDSAMPPTATLKPSTPTMTPTSTMIPTATSVPGTSVTFLTEDGIQIAGTLYGSGDIAVILAHQGTYGATRATWQPLIPALIKEDFTGMPFDFRGFGQTGGPGRIKQLDDDIRAAAKYLRSQNYDRIVCAGSCMGGTACLRAAIDGEPFVGLIILASPFDASGGLVVHLKELEQLTQPRLFITGNQDVYGIERDIKRMYEFSAEPRTLLTFEQSAHGTDLFQTAARQELIDAILNFLISLR